MDGVSNNSPGQDDLLTIEEAGAELHVSRETLAKWRCEGTGPAYVKFGRHVGYRRAALTAFIRSKEISPSLNRRVA